MTIQQAFVLKMTGFSWLHLGHMGTNVTLYIPFVVNVNLILKLQKEPESVSVGAYH